MIYGGIRRGIAILFVVFPSWALAPSGARAQSVSPGDGERLLRQGEAAYRERRFEDSERLFRSALVLREKKFGPWHPTLAADLNEFALVVAAQGKLDEAESLFRRVLAIKEKNLGAEHPGVAVTCTDLALFLARKELSSESISLLLRAYTIRRKALGPENSETGKSLYHLATFLLMAHDLGAPGSSDGRVQQASRYLKQALVIQEKVFGPHHLEVANTLEALASVANQKQDWDEAERLLKRVLEIREKRLGLEHPEVAETIDEYVSYLSTNHQDRRIKKEVDRLKARAEAIRAKHRNS